MPFPTPTEARGLGRWQVSCFSASGEGAAGPCFMPVCGQSSLTTERSLVSEGKIYAWQEFFLSKTLKYRVLPSPSLERPSDVFRACPHRPGGPQPPREAPQPSAPTGPVPAPQALLRGLESTGVRFLGWCSAGCKYFIAISYCHRCWFNHESRNCFCYLSSPA